MKELELITEHTLEKMALDNPIVYQYMRLYRRSNLTFEQILGLMVKDLVKMTETQKELLYDLHLYSPRPIVLTT